MLWSAVVVVAMVAPASARIDKERVGIAKERVDAAIDGLQTYFFDAKGSFWKAVRSPQTLPPPHASQVQVLNVRCPSRAQCGQNGGNGAAPTNFDCTCEDDSPFCKNCFRWWMSTTMQSLMALNEALPGHTSFNLTMRQIQAMREHSPYTSRAQPSWAYIDDYLWYVVMWMHSYDWHGETGDLEEAAGTMELSSRTEVAPSAT